MNALSYTLILSSKEDSQTGGFLPIEYIHNLDPDVDMPELDTAFLPILTIFV